MKLGLALCGGGSLGSYEIGAWKYLREEGLSFDIVTGCSIGAVNGAFVIADAFDKANEIWSSIDIAKVIASNVDIDQATLQKIYVDRAAAAKFIRSTVKNGGIDVEPYYNLVREYVAPLHPEKSDKPYGVVRCIYPSFKEDKVRVNGLTSEQFVDAVLGSSAAWPVFPAYEASDKKKYADGGWKNNLPIDFAYELGADKVIAVALNCVPVPQKAEFEKLPTTMVIRPSGKQGIMFNFSPEPIARNKAMGYLDAKRAFGMLRGKKYYFSKDGFDEVAFSFFRLMMNHGLAAWNKFKLLFGNKTKDPVDAYLLYAEKILALFGITDVMREIDINALMTLLKNSMDDYSPKSTDPKNELRIYLIRTLHGENPKKKTPAEFEIGRYFIEATYRIGK